MFTKFASASFDLVALISLALITGLGLCMTAQLSGAELPEPLAPTDRWASSTAPAAGSVPAGMPPEQNDLRFTDRYFLERLQFSETDEISIYWRLRQRDKFSLDKCFKAISEPPNTPMMIPEIVDYGYCPGWFSRRQPVPLQEISSPLSRLEPTVLYIRRLGEQIGFSEYLCKVDRSKDKERIENRICLNFTDLEKEQLLHEFTVAQENILLRHKKKECWEFEPLICQFDFDSRWWFDPSRYEAGDDPDLKQVEIGAEDWPTLPTF